MSGPLDTFLNILSSAKDLLLVILGFSAIIILHEAGHFFAARWAGIRVLAFAVGFGPAIMSYRRGLGLRKGSSEREYNELVKDAQGVASERREFARTALAGRVSPTEYRLNALPFGGYVKMLGQDDANPAGTSDDPDSYQNCRPWKRMIVISAGVVANIITAAVLFVIVFNPHIGLLEEPCRVGGVEPDRPAAVAVAENAAQLGVTEPGLKAGDRILSVNGVRPEHFNDFALLVAMSGQGDTLHLDVEREGLPGDLKFNIRPEEDPESKMLGIGVTPMASDHLRTSPNKRGRADLKKLFRLQGFPTLEPGMRLVEVGGKPARSPYVLDEIVRRSGGKPVGAVFEGPGGAAGAAERVQVEINPKPALENAKVEIDPASKLTVIARHLLGLSPVLSVRGVEDKSPAQNGGIKEGDIFARVGDVEWPSVPAGIREIHSYKDRDIAVVVFRQVEPGVWKEVDLHTIRTKSAGLLGFEPNDSAYTCNVVGASAIPVGASAAVSGAMLDIRPGSRITAANGRPVATLGQLREALRGIVAADPLAKVTLTVALPTHAGAGVPPQAETVEWQLSKGDSAALASLGWENPLPAGDFEPERFVWRSDTVMGAVPMGLRETKRVMMNTYLTFVRLFQGSVKVEHLKGPVGIAHLGVMVADRGFVWLLFFMGLISVNLAVINFLPIPIADGGHMVFLIYEQITGRPPSVAFQNAAAVVGLVLIGALFLVVTFHDVRNVITDLTRYFRS